MNILGEKNSFNGEKNKIAKSPKAAPSTSHPLLRCQVVLTKRLLVRNWFFSGFRYFYVLSELKFSVYHNFSFRTLSPFKCLNFALSFLVKSQFDFSSCVTIWVFKLCHNLSFQVLSQLKFWVLLLSEVLSFVTICDFESWRYFSFWVLSQFECLSFVTILSFRVCHTVSFWVVIISVFEFSSFNFF